MVLVQWKNVTLGGVVKFTDGVDLTTKPTETWTFEKPLLTMVLLAALLTLCNFYEDPVQILLFLFPTTPGFNSKAITEEYLSGPVSE